jgi:hypothetical protein
VVQKEPGSFRSKASRSIQTENALCGCTLGAPRWDQKQGKSDSYGRSSFFRSRRNDRAAKLTHEDSHVVGTTFLGNLRRILLLHTCTVIGDGQLNLVADLFHTQHDTSCPAGKSVLDGIRRQLVDQKAKRHGAIGIDIQCFCLDLYYVKLCLYYGDGARYRRDAGIIPLSCPLC